MVNTFTGAIFVKNLHFLFSSYFYISSYDVGKETISTLLGLLLIPLKLDQFIIRDIMHFSQKEGCL